MSKELQEKTHKGLLFGWAMIPLLVLIYIFSIIDRTILHMLVKPIEHDLQISHFKMSLLMGPSFGLFYALCGIPIGILVDRYSRRYLISAGIFVWGMATTLSGFANSFVQLLFLRMGVGVGEAVLSPAAYSLISEQFPKEKLSTALASYSVSVVIGGGLSMMLGGTIAHWAAQGGGTDLPYIGALNAWQLVFLIVGGCTLLLVPLPLLLRENIKGREFKKKTAPIEVSDVGDQEPKITVIQLINRDKQFFLGLPLAFGFINVLVAAYGAWMPTFMAQKFDLNIAKIGGMIGMQHILFGIIGQFGTAILVDKLFAKGMKDAHVKYPMYAIMISAPLTIYALMQSDPWIFLALNGMFYMLSFPIMSYAPAALQIFTPTHLRGQISAIMLAIIGLVGLFLGPTLVGLFSDKIFGRENIGQSMMLVTAIFMPLIIISMFWVSKYMRKIYDREIGENPSNIINAVGH